MRRGAPRVVERIARADVAERTRRSDLPSAERLGADLARAIERNALRLHFQPIVDLRSRDCRRVEALLRWRTGRNAVGPAAVVATAEATGQLATLQRWVVRTAARQWASWRDEGLVLGISINLTVPGDADPNLARDVIALLRELKVDPGDFTFETSAVSLLGAAASRRTELRDLGLAGSRVALDDVSPANVPGRSLARELDELKISRSLVSRAASDPGAEREARSLIELARDLHLSTVAVGIEDLRTRDLFAAMGCDLAQGHYLSSPLAAQRIRRWQLFAARLAFGGALAASVYLGALKAAGATGSGGLARGAAEIRVLLPGICSCDLPMSQDLRTATLSTDALRDRTGREFVVESAARADVFVEAAVRVSDRARIGRAVDRDVVGVERAYGTTFNQRPAVYVFATRSSFALGLQQIFGVATTDAGLLAAANGGVMLPRQGAIAINLQNVPKDRELAIVRHELTHALVHEIIGPNGTLPAWVDEGLATLEERALQADDGGAREAAIVLTMLAEGRVALGDLQSGRQWVERNAALSGGAYEVAAEAARLLRARVTGDGLRQILEQTGRGVSFAQAYATIAGESFADFERSFPAQLLAEQGGARIVQQPKGSDVVWTLVGFGPESEVKIGINGAEYQLEYSVTTDRYGMFSGVFGSTAPPGDYSLRANGRGGTAEALLHIQPVGKD